MTMELAFGKTDEGNMVVLLEGDKAVMLFPSFRDL